MLSAFSFVVVLFLLFAYIFGRYTGNAKLNNLFDFSEGNALIWILIVFVILANFERVRDLVRSAVRDKMDTLTVNDVREQLTEHLVNDPKFYSRMVENYKRNSQAPSPSSPPDEEIDLSNQ